ncbi:hypothetical protein N7520_006619 [Penicillium odoratum]|uniref:uncharacterized protein n=1 Tax=Penicillium odoratum TaxID=1167516 RepID=UPI00254662D3|nr:uncharacterized protein N7520_006619 [Penicillium odoratum]KAJ5759463.1 hypothetical protein N7520_006619 [Penicillium odoratum]
MVTMDEIFSRLEYVQDLFDATKIRLRDALIRLPITNQEPGGCEAWDELEQIRKELEAWAIELVEIQVLCMDFTESRNESLRLLRE